MHAALIPLCVLALAEQPHAGDSHLIAVSVPPEQVCPPPRQIADALGARLPGVMLPRGQPARPGMLRLAIATDSTGGIRIDLSDPDGAPLLHRVLAVTRDPGACAALADTIALIIERYWREVGYDPPPLPPPSPPAQQPQPPPPPPPPAVSPSEAAPTTSAAVEARVTAPPPGPAAPWRWSVAAALAGRTGDADARDMSAQIALGAEAGVGVRVSAGASNATSVVVSSGQAEFRRFPVRIGGYLPIRIEIGQLEPGLGLDFDLISFAMHRNDGSGSSPGSSKLCSHRLCSSPGVDVALGWAVTFTHHVYLRALARGGVTVIPYNFVGDNPDPLWRTPSTYLELALESGLWFP